MALTENGTAFQTAGIEGAPVVVLIHGLGMTRATWDDIVPTLERRFWVVTYDLCGHGASALPIVTPSLTVLSEQLKTLLDGLQVPQAALVGFSLGGMINRRFALDYPQRVNAMAVLNSPHERSAEEQRLVEERAVQTAAGGPASTIDATLERWFTPEFRIENPAKVAEIRSWVLANDADNYTKHRRILAEGVLELIRPNPAITTPCLVMTCANDSGSTPAMSEAIAAEITGSETLILPDLKHLGLIEKPAIFATAINDFFTRKLDLVGS